MKSILIAAAFAIPASAVAAETWTLDGSASHLAFGSVKEEYIGEVHRFPALSGLVEDGKAEIAVELGSVDTLIDIRNERMIEHVFNNAPKATISAELDMTAFEGLGAGETTVMETDATLSFLGQDVDVFTEMFVARLGEDKVLVTTNDLLFVATDELGIDPGVDALRDIAGLSTITRAVPVTMRLVFTTEGSSS